MNILGQKYFKWLEVSRLFRYLYRPKLGPMASAKAKRMMSVVEFNIVSGEIQ